MDLGTLGSLDSKVVDHVALSFAIPGDSPRPVGAVRSSVEPAGPASAAGAAESVKTAAMTATVILRMAKALRHGEEEAMARRLAELGIPILARLEGEARAEGGDLLWLDRRTLAVGQGFRTNPEGLRQLRDALAPAGVEVVAVDLPFWTGPEACLHLLSLISLVDEDLAVVYPALLPVSFWRLLRDRGIRLVEVPAEELPSQAPNVLALSPRRCLMLEVNPITRARLEAAGCEVLTYRGQEISLKAEGGPTCLTRPLWRA